MTTIKVAPIMIVSDFLTEYCQTKHHRIIYRYYPDSKVHGANMGPALVLSAPDGPHVGPMNLA